MSSAGHTLLALWRRLSPMPGGAMAFGWILGRKVPYSGTVRPRVLDLEPGFVRIRIRDRRGLRNHLRSVHAIALANVGELTSGLAMTTGLPAGIRGIVVRLRIEYLKKARGTLVAESRCAVPVVTGPTEYDAIATISDADGDVVAKAVVTWKLDIQQRIAD
jgi:acyl-coenzyme A thioesterase PaaI-like protein